MHGCHIDIILVIVQINLAGHTCCTRMRTSGNEIKIEPNLLLVLKIYTAAVIGLHSVICW